MRIVLTGGGSGGHMIPFEPLVQTLRQIFRETKNTLPPWIDRSKLDIYFLGVLDKTSQEFYEGLGLKTINIPAAKMRRYASLVTISDLMWRLPIGMVKALWMMWKVMPDVVISKGGYGSVPVAFAAFVLRVPLLLHESDAVMGMANRIMAHWAQVITVGFAATRHEMGYHRRKTVVTGTPVRPGLARENKVGAKKLFGFAEDEPVVLIMGGSQGAKQINDLTLQILPTLINRAGVIHLTGEKNVDAVRKTANDILKTSERKNSYQLFGSLTDNMGAALMASDLVVSRAGATTLAELAHLHKPAIIIPLALAAQDHQRINAQVMEVGEAVRVISQDNLGRTMLMQNIETLLSNEELREDLRHNIARYDYPNAARDVASLTFRLARGMVPFQTLLSDKKGSAVTSKREK